MRKKQHLHILIAILMLTALGLCSCEKNSEDSHSPTGLVLPPINGSTSDSSDEPGSPKPAGSTASPTPKPTDRATEDESQSDGGSNPTPTPKADPQPTATPIPTPTPPSVRGVVLTNNKLAGRPAPYGPGETTRIFNLLVTPDPNGIEKLGIRRLQFKPAPVDGQGSCLQVVKALTLTYTTASGTKASKTATVMSSCEVYFSFEGGFEPAIEKFGSIIEVNARAPEVNEGAADSRWQFMTGKVAAIGLSSGRMLGELNAAGAAVLEMVIPKIIIDDFEIQGNRVYAQVTLKGPMDAALDSKLYLEHADNVPAPSYLLHSQWIRVGSSKFELIIPELVPSGKYRLLVKGCGELLGGCMQAKSQDVETYTVDSSELRVEITSSAQNNGDLISRTWPNGYVGIWGKAWSDAERLSCGMYRADRELTVSDEGTGSSNASALENDPPDIQVYYSDAPENDATYTFRCSDSDHNTEFAELEHEVRRTYIWGFPTQACVGQNFSVVAMAHGSDLSCNFWGFDDWGNRVSVVSDQVSPGVQEQAEGDARAEANTDAGAEVYWHRVYFHTERMSDKARRFMWQCKGADGTWDPNMPELIVSPMACPTPVP